MQLDGLESIQVAWESLSGLAQDAYREVHDNITPDDYSDTVWSNVIWYLDQVLKHTSPADIALRDEARRMQRKILRLKTPVQQHEHAYGGT